MANAIAKQVLINGPQTYVLKVTIIGDGSGEETATLLNATTGDCGTAPSLKRVVASLTGFSAKLLWDATTDVMVQQLVAEQPIDLDYCFPGGLKNNGGTGVTGDILITTAGLGAGDSGHIYLEIKKG